MAIYEQRPDTARARPGDVFTKKRIDTYQKLFDPSTNLNFYIDCAQTQRLVDRRLKSLKLDRAVINDTKFYVSMVVAVLSVGKPHPTTDDLAKMDVSAITDVTVDTAFHIVQQAYINQGADQDASKGPEMLAEIKGALGM
jgi:hypothetical protein